MTARVYISSTFEDLREERQAVARALRRLGYSAAGMEDYVASPRPPLTRCLEDVRGCKYFIGLYAWRLGDRPPGDARSFTQLEYDEARRNGIPCLLFLLVSAPSWPAGSSRLRRAAG